MVQIKASDLAWKRLGNDKDSALAKVLERAIPDKISIIERDALIDIKIAIYGYMLHINSYIDLKRTIKYHGLNSNDSKNILHSILDSYESNLGLRQLTLICLEKTRKNEKIHYDKLLDKCNMSQSNSIILRSLPEFNFGSKSRLLSKVKEKPLLLPNVVRNNCEATMKNIHPYIKRFVYKKLNFIVKHNMMHHDDMIADLIRKGVETYYRLTPLVTDLHRENSVKQSIHNQGMKFISFYTSKKRARIEKIGENEYQTKIESFVSSTLDKIDDSKIIDDSWSLPFLQIEEENALRQFGLNPHKLRIASTLLGYTNDNFEVWLRNRLKLNENFSLEHTYYTKPRIYVEMIAEYYDIPVLTVKRIAYELLTVLNGGLDKTKLLTAVKG